MLWLFRVLLSTIFLLSVVLSIPIAFDVGGRDAGLAYSLALFLYYSAYSTIKIAVRLAAPSDRAGSQRLRWTVAAVLRLSQWVVLPALLIWALGRFSVDSSSTDWVARTMAHVTGGEGGAGSAVASSSRSASSSKGGGTAYLGSLAWAAAPAAQGASPARPAPSPALSLVAAADIRQVQAGATGSLVAAALSSRRRWAAGTSRSATRAPSSRCLRASARCWSSRRRGRLRAGW